MAVATRVEIKAPNFQYARFKLRGTSNLVMCQFGEKAKNSIHKTQAAGSADKVKKKKEPKDFQKEYEDSKHMSTEGWVGIPTSAIRAGMISACRICGYAMTVAKLAIFPQNDGYQADGTGLIKISKGESQYFETYVRLPSGPTDLRARARFAPGWEADVTIKFDADMISISDITNLITRVGDQVGLLEGRPDSKKSCGCG